MDLLSEGIYGRATMQLPKLPCSFAIKSLWKQERQKLVSKLSHFLSSEVDFLDNLSVAVSTQDQDFPGRWNEKAKNQYRQQLLLIITIFIEI